MDAKKPSSSACLSRKWKYDVFLSFRGEDTRRSFTDHFYTTLKQKGIFTFRDDEKLERGEPIKPKLLKAIEESRFAIVILSKNYGSSTWCLDELVKIMECKESMGSIVYPIFYDVDPSEVRKQTGTYAQAFVKHEKENIEKVHMWRAALIEVANLSGWYLHDRYESEFIRDIVESISHKLRYPFPRNTKGLVGIDSRVEELMSLLAIGSNDVRIIGIWGMGGTGKTTLARVVYEMVFSEFEGDCFITNVRIESEKFGLLPLQQKLIRDILMEKNVNIRDVDDGVLMIMNRLCHKRILLVLDDVNDFNQLEKLAGESNWFGPGSRVIITTREEHLLKMHTVCGIYEVEELNEIEALRLFSLKAFKEDHPPKDFLELSAYFLNYAKGLPLAIVVLGSFLCNKSKEEWESALDRLKKYPEKGIFKILEISFDGLQDTEKEIFLHIACFLNMKDKDYIIEILDCLGLFPKIGLKVLIEKSLVKYFENKYWMHELLQRMGQDIVCRDYPQEPGKWSKLWLYKDIHNVLMKNTEMKAIQGLVLELGELHKSETIHWNLEAFSKMPNLKLLIIHDVHLLHGPKNLPNGLRYLDWSRYPGKSLPSSFQSNELVELSMCHSKIIRLWEGIKHYDKLKSIKLNDSLNLIATPNVTGVPNLKKLVFKGCINLCVVDPSILVHKRLTLLNLENCKSLSSLPNKFEMESLEILILSNCSQIKRIPEFMGNMKSLLKLHLEGTAITKLPSSIEHLTNLASLDLSDCKNLACLPTIVWSFKSLLDINLKGCKNLSSLPDRFAMESLEILILSGCSKIKRIPEFIENMERLSILHLDGTAITKLPSSIEHLTNLVSLHLRDCKNLVCLPSIICDFKLLKDIRVARCPKLENLPENLWNIKSLEVLDVSGVTITELPASVLSRNLKELSFRGCKVPRSMGFLLPSLSGLRSLVRLDLSDCNLLTIPSKFGCLSSLLYLDLSGNNFDYLPKSIIQLSNLRRIYVRNCMRLRSLPQLPSSTSYVFAEGCISLETLPSRLTLRNFDQPCLYFFDCFKLADNQGWTDMLFTMLSGYAQGIYKACNTSFLATTSIVVPGSEIPRWFSHQSAGAIVNAHVTHSCNKWIGMAVCTVFSLHYLHQEYIMKGCYISVNNPGNSRCFGFLNHKFVQTESDHLWLLYIHPECFSENERADLSQIDENGIIHMEVEFDCKRDPRFECKKSGFRMVYEQDIEEIREMMAQSSNSSCIVPYEGLRSYAIPIPHNHPYKGVDVDAQHDFDNSTEGSKIDKSHDEYNGAGPSGEGSSNDVPHSRRIQIYRKDVWLVVALTMVTLIARILIKVVQDYL